jgi:MFS family permease
MGCGFLMCACFVLFPLAGAFPLMLALVATAGVLNAVLNSLIPATLQLVVPPEMRGKVFALLSSLAQGLTPISMALGGVLAEFIPVPVVISASFGIMLLLFLPFLFGSSVRRLINFDPSVDRPESLLG